MQGVILMTPIKNNEQKQLDECSQSETTLTSGWCDQTIKKKQSTPVSNNNSCKQKVFQLINQNVEIKKKNNKLQSAISQLQQKIRSKDQQLEQFLMKIECKSLKDAISLYQKINKSICTQFNNRNQMHKKIIENSNKILQNIPDSFISQRKTEEINSKLNTLMSQYYKSEIQRNIQKIYKKYENNNKTASQQNYQLNQYVKQLKIQYESIFQQNIKLKSSNDCLKEDLQKSIEKYEEIENIIQIKMKMYIDKIRQYQQILKNQNQNKESSAQQPVYFSLNTNRSGDMSFCKENQPDQLPKFNEIIQQQEGRKNELDNYEMNSQCYRASIQGLLQQNKRLKKSFQALYKVRQGQQVPEQLIKEINIMKSILQLNQSMESIS